MPPAGAIPGQPVSRPRLAGICYRCAGSPEGSYQCARVHNYRIDLGHGRREQKTHPRASNNFPDFLVVGVEQLCKLLPVELLRCFDLEAVHHRELLEGTQNGLGRR